MSSAITTSTRLLEIQPKELKFIFELKKQTACSVRLTNGTDNHVAFKVKTTSPKKYCVRPNVGIVLPNSSCEFTVTMQAQKVAPPDMVCRDKFLIQSTVVPVGTTDKDITPFMFSRDNGRYIEEIKLRVALISPPGSPVLSPINGGFKRGPPIEVSVPKDPVLRTAEILTPQQTVAKDVQSKMSNGQELNPLTDSDLKVKLDRVDVLESKSSKETQLIPETDFEYGEVKRYEEVKQEKTEELEPKKDSIGSEQVKLEKLEDVHPGKDTELRRVTATVELNLVNDIEAMKSKLNVFESKLNEAESTISKLTEERRTSIQERKNLQQELAALRSKTSAKRVQVGFPFLYVVMVAFVSVVLGYISRH